MNDWDRYYAQQANYNLIAIVFRPKVFLFLVLMGLVLQLSIGHKDSSSGKVQKSVKQPTVEQSVK